jgi:hypothetical protein
LNRGHKDITKKPERSIFFNLFIARFLPKNLVFQIIWLFYKQRLLPMQQPPLFSSLFSTQTFFSSKRLSTNQYTILLD